MVLSILSASIIVAFLIAFGGFGVSFDLPYDDDFYEGKNKSLWVAMYFY